VALPILVVVILAEELVFRGALMDLLSERMGGTATVLVASVLYLLPQLGVGSWLLMLVAFGCGLAWSALRQWTGTLVAPTVAHLIWDFVVFVLLPVA
ncbi:MAG: CPBP family intramembrane glutamic endopeptidase, partial [Polyangiales bacterium]